MSYDVFIKIDGITGESKDAKHQGEIEFVYKEQKPDGTLGSGDKVAWDIKTNKLS